jgi:hypothetical protein
MRLRLDGVMVRGMGVCRGVAINSLKFHPGLPCPTLLRPAGWLSLKQPYDRFMGDPPTGWAACSRLLPLWTPHTVRLWCAGLFGLSRPGTFFIGYP